MERTRRWFSSHKKLYCKVIKKKKRSLQEKVFHRIIYYIKGNIYLSIGQLRTAWTAMGARRLRLEYAEENPKFALCMSAAVNGAEKEIHDPDSC